MIYFHKLQFFSIAGAQSRRSHQQPISLLILQNMNFSESFNFANCNFSITGAQSRCLYQQPGLSWKICQLCFFTKRNFFLNDLFLQIAFFLSQEHSRVVPISNWFHSLSCKTWSFLNRLILQIAIFYISGAQSCRLYQQPVSLCSHVNNVFLQNCTKRFFNHLFL